jgi:hypothetical protein
MMAAGLAAAMAAFPAVPASVHMLPGLLDSTKSSTGISMLAFSPCQL